MFKKSSMNYGNLCKECKGSCWVPDNQQQTQENAKKIFGIIPNRCINGSDGAVNCPVALKKMQA